MATIKRFEDIEAWKKARELTREVYRHSKVWPVLKGLRAPRSNASRGCFGDVKHRRGI